VIQEALRRRHVHLEWLKVNQILEMSESSSLERSLIGWVLNTPVEEENMWKRLVLPRNRRHWLAVIKIPSDVRHNEDNSTSTAGWIVLDSNGSVSNASKQKEQFKNNKFDSLSLLVEYLMNQMKSGCIIFKATATDDFVPMA
jgi:hypothetical protein